MRDSDVSGSEILAACAEALASNPGASMEELALAAGLSRATLYRAYPSREALLRATALDALASVEAGLKAVSLRRGDSVEVLRRIAEVLVPLGAKFHFLASEDWLEKDERVASRLANLERAVAGVLERAREQDRLERSTPLEWQLRVFFALVYAGWESVAGEVLVPRDAVQAVFSSFLGGQGTQAAGRAGRKARHLGLRRRLP